MSWPSLASRLNTLPRVLAGPILRDVTQLSVTVWFALRVPAKVTLRVFAPDDTMILTGTADTCAIGRNLHIVAVTADQLTPPKTGLSENAVYRYKAIFDFKGGESQVPLEAATNNASLSYAPYNLPSFSVAPKDLNRLRLIQGSCRRPYAGARDMLPHLDGLIAAAASKPLDRPHQLLLTGDQIYADDVSDPMRVLVTDAADALLGWEELLPLPAQLGGPVGARNIHAPLRWGALKSGGFPSDDLRSHLLSLGEYLSMYLLVWSPVLWPASMPSVADVQAEMRGDAQNVRTRLYGMGRWDLFKDLPDAVLDAADSEAWIKDTTKILAAFQATLGDVRRALANVPSYMIFDDHEITDDWNMTTQFCNDIYGSALGKQVVQNGLVAFALCQHWGNVPALFRTPTSGTPPAGARLLAMLDTANPEKAESYANKAAQYGNSASDLRRVLAIHTPAELRASKDRAVYHDAAALRYDFTVEGSGHQVIFTDTRTWRSFPPDPPDQRPIYSGDPGTHLLRKFGATDQFHTQIVDTPPTGTRLLFVVVTTNAPPGQGIRGATRHDRLTHTFDSPDADLYEAWDIPSESFDRLLTALTTKLPVDSSGKHTGTIVLLSGDVHHSYATRIGYRATQRYEDTTDPRQGAAATIVQLVGSGLKNIAEKTIGLHEEGHFYTPHLGLGNFVRQSLKEAYVGFSFDGAAQPIGTGPLGAMTFPLKVSKQTIDVSFGDAPWDRMEPRGIKLSIRPHYRYRLDYILPAGTTPLVAPIPMKEVTGNRSARARIKDENEANKKRNQRVNPIHVVGVANLCEVAIAGSPQPTTISHKVLWWDEYTNVVRTTTYVIPASVSDPKDPVWGDIRAAEEPIP